MSNPIDVLLINPPFDRLQGRRRGYFPMGLAYLAAALKSAGIRTAVYNAEASRSWTEARPLRQAEMISGRDIYLQALENPRHLVWQEARRILEETRPAVVGVSVWTEKMDAARIITKLAKEVCPTAPVIWGGPHATLLVEECVSVPDVDFVVKGEGERTVVELVRKLLSGNAEADGIPGVYYRDKTSGQVRGSDRSYEMDLDSLPRPDWESGVSDDDWTGRHGGVQCLMSSRGCPYPCKYCAVESIWGKKVRFHSVDRVIEEIESRIRLTGNRRFHFWDDSFTLDGARTKKLCQALIDKNLKIVWTCITRPDLVDADLIRMLQRAGCRHVTFGVESASPRMLQLIGKAKSTAEVDRAFAVCQAAGMRYNAYYMLGFPDETEEDMAMTVEHLCRCGAVYVGLSIFTPYPGTALYDRAIELGLLKEPVDWSRLGRHSRHNHFVAAVPAERFQAIVDHAFREVDRVNNTPTKRLKAFVGESRRMLRHFMGTGKIR
jgi:anaerobic magnesium-protoporphyrin IX monomethyl ester cyclase